MYDVICFYNLSAYPIVARCKVAELWVLTSGKHALHEVVDVAEYDSEALWGALLPHQRLDLNALQYGLRYGGIWILARVEYRSEDQREY